MKSFFEEYGLVVLGILAVIVLICMVSPLGTTIQKSLNDTVTGFDTSVDTAVGDAFDKVADAHKEVPTAAEEEKEEEEDREDAGLDQHPETGDLEGQVDLEEATYVLA